MSFIFVLFPFRPIQYSIFTVQYNTVQYNDCLAYAGLQNTVHWRIM